MKSKSDISTKTTTKNKNKEKFFLSKIIVTGTIVSLLFKIFAKHKRNMGSKY